MNIFWRCMSVSLSSCRHETVEYPNHRLFEPSSRHIIAYRYGMQVRKWNRYFDEMMNIYSKYVIVRHIDIHQILINGYLPMNGKYALPCRFSFGEYSDEKLMSIHTANIQIFIFHFIKSSDFYPSSTRLGNGIGRVPICCNRSSHFRFQRQR